MFDIGAVISGVSLAFNLWDRLAPKPLNIQVQGTTFTKHPKENCFTLVVLFSCDTECAINGVRVPGKAFKIRSDCEPRAHFEAQPWQDKNTSIRIAINPGCSARMEICLRPIPRNGEPIRLVLSIEGKKLPMTFVLHLYSFLTFQNRSDDDWPDSGADLAADADYVNIYTQTSQSVMTEISHTNAPTSLCHANETKYLARLLLS